jgi:hypothetical protein
MKAEYATVLWTAIIETSVQFEVQSIASQELVDYKGHIDACVAAELQSSFTEALAAVMLCEAAEDGVASEKAVAAAEAIEVEAVQASLYAELLELLDNELDEEVQAAVAEEEAEALKVEADSRQAAKALRAVTETMIEDLLESMELAKLVRSWLEQEEEEAYQQECIDNPDLPTQPSSREDRILAGMTHGFYAEICDCIITSLAAEEVLSEMNDRLSEAIHTDLLEEETIPQLILLVEALEVEEIQESFYSDLLESLTLNLHAAAQASLVETVEEEEQDALMSQALAAVVDTMSEEVLDSLSETVRACLSEAEHEMYSLACAVFDSFVNECFDSEDFAKVAEATVGVERSKEGKRLEKMKIRAEAEASEMALGGNTKAVEAVLDDLIEEMVSLSWLKDFSEVELNDARHQTDVLAKYAERDTIDRPSEQMHIAFTPGMHSPNVYSQASLASLVSMSVASEHDEEVVVSFVYLADTKGTGTINLSNVGDDLTVIYKVVKDYYAQLKEPILSTALSYDDLLEAETGLSRPCWYWLLVNKRIGGLVLFSLNSSESSRRVEVVHFSTLYLAHYKPCLSYFCGWLWSSDPCEEVRVHLYCGQGLPNEVKKAFTTLEFRWKSHIDEAFPSYTRHTMGLDRPSGAEFGDDSLDSEALEIVGL